MLPGLTGLPSVSTSVSSKSGDANAGGQDAAFQYNAAFQVGGSGTTAQTQTAEQTKAPDSGSNSTLVYVALGVSVLAVLLFAVSSARRS